MGRVKDQAAQDQAHSTMDLLSQAYRNNWTLYEQALRGTPSIAHWDVCVLTAANERQARAYELQLQERRELGALSPATQWIVVPDPDGARIGSGGATLNVLLRVIRLLASMSGPGQTISEAAASALKGRRVLIVHSGGDSKRLPHYSAFGKLFARVPHELPDGRASTLFDEFVVSLSGIPLHMHEGVLIASGDVLLVFDHTQLDFSRQGVVGVGMRVPAELGTRHGVFVADRSSNQVRRFLHKPSLSRLEEMDALDEEHRVDVDTGMVWMDPEIAARLAVLAEPNRDWNPAPGGMLSRLVKDRVAVNLYGDVLGALPPEAAFESYLNDASDGEATDRLRVVRKSLWETVRGCSFTMQSLRPAKFLHLGSTSEYRDTMLKGAELDGSSGWSDRVLCSIAETANVGASRDVTVVASVIGKGVTIGAGSVVEDSMLQGPVEIGSGCVIAGARCSGDRRLSLDNDIVLHRLPVYHPDEGKGVVWRMYGISDNPKLPLTHPTMTFLNLPVREWMARAGIEKERIWGGLPDSRATLWNARLFPLTTDLVDGWEMAAWMQRPEEALPAEKDAWLHTPRLSLEESYVWAGLETILHEAHEVEDRIRIDLFLEGLCSDVFSIDAAARLGKPAQVSGRRLERVVERIRADSDLLFRLRVLKSAADILRAAAPADREVQVRSDVLDDEAFDALSDLIQSHTAPVYVSSGYDFSADNEHRAVIVGAPARVDFGGGWSDTPPFSIEHGGVVLNAAISLNGKFPILVKAARTRQPGLALESVDLGVKQRIDCNDLAGYKDLSDPLAIHKAAILLSGLDVNSGGGLHLSTEIDIPKGSGLGTSSIMGGAVMAALNYLRGANTEIATLTDQVLCLEQMLTTGGGWQDQVGGLIGGIKLVVTEPGLPQRPQATPVSLPAALNEQFVLVYTGQRRLAKRILRGIMGRYVSRDPVVVSVLHEIRRIAVVMKEALEREDLEMFGSLMSRHWELNKLMDPGSTSPFIDHLFEQIAPYALGAKLTGAGGGGFAEIIVRDGEAARRLASMLEQTYPDAGVRVWPCHITTEGLVLQETTL